MTLACVLDERLRPATIDEIRLAAERDADPLAIAILRTPDPEQTVEALHVYAAALEGAYPGCDLSVDLSDLSERSIRDHRLDHIVAILETT